MAAPGSGVGGQSSQAQVARFFKPGQPGTIGAPQEQLPVHVARKKGEPLKPESEVGLAKLHLDAAIQQPDATQRDKLLDMARQEFARAIQGNPQLPEAYEGLGKLYLYTDDKEHAVATLQAGVQQVPPTNPMAHKLAHQLAGAHIKYGEYAAAEQVCQVALRSDPQNRGHLKTLALCQAYQDQWDAAFKTLVDNKAMTQPEARYFLGRTLLDVGRTSRGPRADRRGGAARPELRARQADTRRAGRGRAVAQPGRDDDGVHAAVVVSDEWLARRIRPTAIFMTRRAVHLVRVFGGVVLSPCRGAHRRETPASAAAVLARVGTS